MCFREVLNSHSFLEPSISDMRGTTTWILDDFTARSFCLANSAKSIAAAQAASSNS